MHFGKGDISVENQNNKDNKKIRDYSEDAVYNRRKAYVTALLKWLECEFFGLFVFLSLFAMSVLLGNVGNFLFGTFGLICYICVMADFGIKEGAKAHIKNTVRGDDVKRGFGLKLGLIAMIPAALSYVLLLLSYFGVIGSAVLSFKALNLGLWGYINLFAHSMKIAEVSPVLLVIYPITMLIYPITTWLTFKIGYDNEDLQTKIMYKKV
jgi:hypothetical protein